jgi:iron complex transport system substrate-binding protein
MRRHSEIARRWALAAAIVAVAGSRAWATAEPEPARIVSLAPSITETLYAIGAGEQLVGISDFCPPPEGRELPRTGSSLRPSYEAIARLRPTLIVGEQNASTPQRALATVAPTRLLPWLTLDEIAAGVGDLGRLAGREAAAAALAQRLLSELRVEPAANAPRALLVIGGDFGTLDDLVFIRRNSLHGAALEAAGARNAVAADVHGAPRLALERVFRLDPDVIIVLSSTLAADAALAPWRRLGSLRAVREGRLAALAVASLSNGPSVLDLRTRLAAVIGGMTGGR